MPEPWRLYPAGCQWVCKMDSSKEGLRVEVVAGVWVEVEEQQGDFGVLRELEQASYTGLLGRAFWVVVEGDSGVVDMGFQGENHLLHLPNHPNWEEGFLSLACCHSVVPACLDTWSPTQHPSVDGRQFFPS